MQTVTIAHLLVKPTALLQETAGASLLPPLLPPLLLESVIGSNRIHLTCCWCCYWCRCCSNWCRRSPHHRLLQLRLLLLQGGRLWRVCCWVLRHC